MKSPRRRARELAVQAIYQAGINKTAAPEIAKNIRELSQAPNMDEAVSYTHLTLPTICSV